LGLEIRALEERLLALQGGEEARPPRRRGRPAETAKGVSGWPADPEERKKEMARRMEVAKKNRRYAGHSQRMQGVSKKLWDNMTPEQRAGRIAAMQAGKAIKGDAA
jgi:hypothetical protein